MGFAEYNRYWLNEANRQRQWDGQTWRCPLASHSGTEWGFWESGTSWQRAPHQCTPKEKGDTHQAPLSTLPSEPSVPPVTHSGPRLQSMNRGWALGGFALLHPGVDWLWSWLDASGSCQELQREMDELLCWLLGTGWWCVPSDGWVYTVSPDLWVKLIRPGHETTILSWRSFKVKERNRRFVNWADGGKLLRGRADSIIKSSVSVVVAQTTGGVSQKLSNQDRLVINALAEV